MRVGLETREFAFVEATADSKTVDRNSVAEELFNGVAVSIAIALTVFTVGNQENHLAAVAATVLQKLCRFVNGVIERLGGFFTDDHGRWSRWG